MNSVGSTIYLNALGSHVMLILLTDHRIIFMIVQISRPVIAMMS